MVRKIVIGAVVALALAYPLSSWLLGFVVEKRINEPLEQIRAATPYFQVTENTFRRGWFSSEQDLTLELLRGLPAAPGAAPTTLLAPMQVRMNTVIHHGPLCGLTCVGIAHTETHIVFSGEVQQLMAAVFGGAEPLHIETRMGFRGGGTATITSPPVKDMVLKDGAHLSWGGLAFKSRFSAAAVSYDMHVSMPAIVYTGAEGKRFEVSELAVDVASHSVLRTLYEGNSTFAVARAALSSPASGSVVIKNIQVATQSDSSGGFMNVVSKSSTGALETAPLTLADTHFDFSFRHLEMESLEAMSAAMRDINEERSAPAAARTARMLRALKTPGISFLSHQPEFGIDRINVAAAQGAAQLSGVVRLQNVVPADFSEQADAKALIQKLRADLDFTLDDGFLKSLPGEGAQFAGQLNVFADQGLATHENGKFHTLIVFQQGTLTFNGKPFQKVQPLPNSQPAQSPPPPQHSPAAPRR